MEPNGADWYAADAFWAETYPFLFSEARFAAAIESIPKLRSLAGVSSGKVLDLACGPGRHAIPLAQAGYEVTGVDRTPFLLDKARELADRAGVSVEWLQEDMREFARPEAFDLALSMFTSFGYFEDAAENRRVLQNVYASLKPGGVFVLDHFGKEILAANYQPTRSEETPDGRLLIQRVSVIDDWSRVAGEWTVISKSGVSTFHNCHWLYSGRELRDLLASVGFPDISLYGSLERTPYAPQAQRLIAVARKTRS